MPLRFEPVMETLLKFTSVNVASDGVLHCTGIA
jgi:hypothetical protein